eukprot:4958521-Alexandrium_andersonii.AAC.1
MSMRQRREDQARNLHGPRPVVIAKNASSWATYVCVGGCHQRPQGSNHTYPERRSDKVTGARGGGPPRATTGAAGCAGAAPAADK